MNNRRTELTERLTAIQKRISAATPEGVSEPELIVISKFFPASDVRILRGLGVRNFGENRDQEAGPKAEETADLELSWHFVGQLQTNKARTVVRYASAIHSVDRISLVKALDKAKARFKSEVEVDDPYQLRDKKLQTLIQIDLDPQAGQDANKPRGGALPAEISDIADAIANSEWLTLAGVMAVAPLGEDPEQAFAKLAELHEVLLQKHPEATWRSAGMSHDLEEAVKYGATHLRIGSDVLGERPPLR